MTPSADSTDAVVAALEGVQADLKERKELDVARAERDRRWKREIRRYLAAMCLGIFLLVVGNVMVLLGLVVSRSNQHQLRENQGSILAGNARVQAVTDCIITPGPSFQACVAARLPTLPPVPESTTTSAPPPTTTPPPPAPSTTLAPTTMTPQATVEPCDPTEDRC